MIKSHSCLLIVLLLVMTLFTGSGIAETEVVLSTTYNEETSTSSLIDGLEPLYTTVLEPFVTTGTTLRMRAEQDLESEIVCVIDAWDPLTVYAVYPEFVLVEYEGYVGYVIRTWVDEDMVTINPDTTPPYGVTPMSYVATLLYDNTPIYFEPDDTSEVCSIMPGAGSKITIIEFVDGYAKVAYYRQYGYIHASNLTDLVTVSPTNDPLSDETPIAAYCSFFYYNTGAEGNEGRCKNIVRTCESMTRVLEPGETFNFNTQVGPYSAANGYFQAPVLVDGGSQMGSGGGTCQSSSTLYNTIRQLPGITVLQRRAHGPGCASYLPMHQDAAVGTTELNLIIRNDYDYALKIVAECMGTGVLCIQIFRAD